MAQIEKATSPFRHPDNDPDNLIALCITCHSDVHTKRPFTRRFTFEEQKQHRDAVFKLVALGKLVPPEDETVEAPAAEPAPTANTVPREALASRLSGEARHLLLTASRSHSGCIKIVTGSTTTITIDINQPVTALDDARKVVRYKDGLQQLVDHQLVECVNQTGLFSRDFQITRKGFLAADELEAIIRQHFQLRQAQRNQAKQPP
jgi:hypothetical protein